MSRRYTATVVAGAVAVLACTNWTVRCTVGGCQPAMSQLDPTHSAGLALLLVVASVAVLWTIRCAWLAASSRRALGALPSQAIPTALSLAAERTGLSRVVVLSSSSPVAFCAGFLRPTVFVSAGLLSRLERSELDAVLVHERHHAERRDPLRRMVMGAIKDALFFLPLLEWWIAGRVVESELAADRRALAEVGLRPLAGALWATGNVPALPVMAGFMGATAIRAAHLTGTPVPARRATGRAVIQSAIGLAAVAAVAMCAVATLP